MRLLLIMLLTTLVFAGCSAQMVAPKKEYPSAVMTNNIQYNLSTEKVVQNQLGKQIGEVKYKVEPMPEKNEESNEAPVGSKLYEIKGLETKVAIAVEINGEYRKANALPEFFVDLLRRQ